MRIIAGEFRGRKLDAPRGDGTRPTTDRVRESLMSALVSLRDGLDGAVVLDASPARGPCPWRLFPAAPIRPCSASATGTPPPSSSATSPPCASAAIGRASCAATFSRRGAAAPGRPFDLIFLDPPYATDPAEVFGLLSRLDAADALAADLIVATSTTPPTTMPWRRWPKRPATK